MDNESSSWNNTTDRSFPAETSRNSKTPWCRHQRTNIAPQSSQNVTAKLRSLDLGKSPLFSLFLPSAIISYSYPAGCTDQQFLDVKSNVFSDEDINCLLFFLCNFVFREIGADIE